jgi:peptidoglycan/xylan/chitin deacetylase (PgdA/CDA1 family)
MPSRGSRPFALPALPALLMSLVLVAGCLPTTLGPTPSPAPTESPGPTGTSAPTASPTPAGPTPAPTTGWVEHVVAPGESLLSIGRRYETTGRSIAYWNRATYPTLDPESDGYAPDQIQAGWVLRVLPGEEYDPDSEETPPAAPTPSPRATIDIPPAPTPAGSTSSALVSNGARGGNAVALTFDMGGRLDPAVDIMRWLIDNNVPATIFPTGKSASTTSEGRAVLALIAANPGLLTVANHSWDHPNFTELSASQMADQLRRTEAVIAEATGRSSMPFFRPPYGAQNKAVLDGVGAAGYPYTVMWDIDTIDWRPVADGGPTAEGIRSKVLSRAEGGSIVLMHLGGWNTLEALPGLVQGLRERGLVPVTLHRLLGVEPRGG